MKKKAFIIIGIAVVAIVLICISIFLINKNNQNEQQNIYNEESIPEVVEEEKNEIKEEKKVSIIDLNSKTRKFAITLNNFPTAVNAQTGLSDSYLIYEIPVEGGYSRSLAIFKDKLPQKYGTVRSARHNFIDYAKENDAIFVHFGWSFIAEREIKNEQIEHIDGNTSDPAQFWRENPLSIAYEHTVYTNAGNLLARAKEKGYRTISDKKEVLSYSADEIVLDEISGNAIANTITIPYSNLYSVNFKYNEENKRYYRYVNSNPHVDIFTKEHFSTKNIIVTQIGYGPAEGGYYLDLKNTGTGKAYYITNGRAIEITWQKNTRDSQTIYKYKNGEEIKVNDGNTYIMIMKNDCVLTIE